MTRRLVIACLVLGLLASSADAAFYDFEQITVAAVSIGFSSAKITPSGKPPMSFAQCRLRTAEISYLYTDSAATTVTSSVGTLMEVGDYITFTLREDLLNFRAIRTTSTSGQLDCHYKGQ